MTVVKEYIEGNDQLQTPTTLRVGNKKRHDMIRE
jgi:hypothetical protein